MNENEAIYFVEKFFKEHNWKITREAYVHRYRVDILAEKNNGRFFVECRGDNYRRSHEIHVMIGQIVSKMHETGPNIHYGLAMPYSLATYLKEFGIEGIRALKLHLFIIGQGDMWNGQVFYLDTENTLSFIVALKKGDQDASSILFTSMTKEI